MFYIFILKSGSDLNKFQISVMENKKWSDITFNLQYLGDYSETKHYYPLIYLYCYGNF